MILHPGYAIIVSAKLSKLHDFVLCVGMETDTGIIGGRRERGNFLGWIWKGGGDDYPVMGG